MVLVMSQVESDGERMKVAMGRKESPRERRVGGNGGSRRAARAW
jgi:hypothetical protein